MSVFSVTVCACPPSTATVKDAACVPEKSWKVAAALPATFPLVAAAIVMLLDKVVPPDTARRPPVAATDAAVAPASVALTATPSTEKFRVVPLRASALVMAALVNVAAVASPPVKSVGTATDAAPLIENSMLA